MKIRSGDRGSQRFAEQAKSVHIESQVPGPVSLEVREGEAEKPDGGVEPASILGVLGPGRMLLEMNECACDLDQALEEGVMIIAVAQPKVFEHVVRFVITLGIEAGEITSVAGIEFPVGFRRERPNEGGNAVTFFHLAGRLPGIILRTHVRDKMRSNSGVSARSDAL